MRKFTILWAILLFISVDPAIGQTDINSIRFGSTGDPLNGLTISWANEEGTADSISWGNTADLENGKFAGLMSTSIILTQFDYTFPVQTAGSTIHYSILDSKRGVWTEPRTYLTASDASDDKFSFSVIGDSQTQSSGDMWRPISEAIFDTDFTLFLGGIVASGSRVSDWRTWFEYGEKFVSRELVYHTVGNHDADDSPSRIDNFLGLYTLPGNELYYSFTYGNAVFICLYSQDPGDTEQYNWLLSTLEANNDKTWKIVFFHKPFFTAPTYTGEMDGYFNTWWKAFDDYGVDIIFNGHTHNYQRTKPINRNVSKTSSVENYGSGEGQGRCQIVAGSAGPLCGAADPSFWWLDNSESKRHFCNIDIDGDVLSFKVLDANHVVFDSLVLSKSSEITFQVDLTRVTDLYDGGAVQLIFGARDSTYVMTDTDGDSIYTFAMRIPFETDLKYFFSYQTGANPDTDFNDEDVPSECGDPEGYRVLKVPHGNLTLPAVLFGSCVKASQDITFQVDLGKVTYLYDGGAVWLVFGAWDTSYVMTDIDADSIYTITVPVPAGTELKYFFAYQTGADPESNYVEESAPAECGDAEGYRLLKVPDSALTLPAVMFGSCEEDLGPQITLSIPIVSGNNDAEEYRSDVGGEVIGNVDIGSSDLELVFDSEAQYVGMIFRNVAIPVGATITNAYVQFTVDTLSAGTTDAQMPPLEVYGAKEANVTGPFAETPFNVSSHPSTIAKVTGWMPGPSVAEGDKGPNEQTPDLSAIIQEIIGIAGWASGNNIMIVVTGDPGQTENIKREFESFNGDPAGAPVLNVTFSEGTGINSVRGELSSSIYPNPTKGKFYIVNPFADLFSYEIFTVNGHLVSTKHSIFGSTAEVDISGLLKGVYFIKVRSAEISETHKLILQ